VVIDYNASWCAPCHKIKPFFEKLSMDHDAVFLSVDIEKVKPNEIQSVPTFRFYEGNRLLGFYTGSNEKELEVHLKIYLNNK